MDTPSLTVGQQRLESALVKIDKNPSIHNQEIWIGPCGTVGCLAGHIVIDAGYNPTGRYLDSTSSSAGTYLYVTGPDGVERPIHSLAEELIGLDAAIVENDLFFPDKDMDDLWSAARVLTDGRVNREDAMRRASIQP